MPDEAKQLWNSRVNAKPHGCLALHLQNMRTCPYCRRVARTEQTKPTERWQNLVRVHNQQIQANINAGGGIYTGIPPRSPRTPSPPIQEQQQQQQHHHRQRAQRRPNMDRTYEISAIVCSRRTEDDQSRELRIHWRGFAYREDAWENKSEIERQAPLIYGAWCQMHDAGHTPPFDQFFPERPQPWMTNVRAGRHIPEPTNINKSSNPEKLDSLETLDRPARLILSKMVKMKWILKPSSLASCSSWMKTLTTMPDLDHLGNPKDPDNLDSPDSLTEWKQSMFKTPCTMSLMRTINGANLSLFKMARMMELFKMSRTMHLESLASVCLVIVACIGHMGYKAAPVIVQVSKACDKEKNRVPAGGATVAKRRHGGEHSLLGRLRVRLLHHCPDDDCRMYLLTSLSLLPLVIVQVSKASDAHQRAGVI
uniref:Chromo domain-containing protein n=1 Tax=Globodera pallida TaxID=36090 RepID=A0A183CJK5_GLOPA